LTFRTPAQGDDGTPVPTIDVVMPLHIQDMTKPVGSLELEIDLSASAQLLKKRYWDIRRDLLGKLGLVMVSFGVLSFFTLRRQIVTRITDIARVAHSISRGDLRRRVRDMGPDEIGALAGALNQMTDSLENTIADLKHTQYLTMTKLAELAEKRDPDTGAHLQRMPRYCQVLAQALRCDSPYAELLDDEFIQTLIDSSPLHDIGKVAVPDRILLKPGPLTADEFAIMQRHPLVGADVLTGAGFLKMACDMALCHHERYDGSGYPNHLAGDQIPLAARIVALADMYDALTSRRVYKEAYTHEEAFALIREPSTHEQASAILAQESGRRFDPHVMQAFLRCESEFRSIREQLADY
jgi:response regulator RpfG family c-di-GMP phosphodiesterase